MKKTLLIIGGAIFILLLIGLWVYVMFFGTPQSIDSVFGGFAGDDTNLTTTDTPISTPTTTEPVPAISNKPLRQLTTKPVIGFMEVQNSPSSTPEVLYAESGTGHIFSINLTTGVEERRSGTTISEAARAAFSDDGRYVAIQSGTNRNQKIYLGEMSSTGTLKQIPFSASVHDFSITSDNVLLYTVREAARTVAYGFNFNTKKEQQLFTIPFREAVVSWGNNAAGTHYVYPSASYLLEGFLYVVKAGKLARLPVEGYGLVAFGSGALTGVSYSTGDRYESYFFDTANNQSIPSVMRLLPEKCTGSASNTKVIWCAADSTPVEFGFPDSWYRGDISFKDTIYEFTKGDTSNSLIPLLNLSTKSGRDIDAIDISINNINSRLYFTNKNDRTLWTYDLTK